MNQPSGVADANPAPPPPPHGLRALFSIKEAPSRWSVAVRAAICAGAPLVAGWLTGLTAFGLMASLGAFTSLYGSGRPYLNRARYLALVALSFAAAVALGLTVETIPWLVIPTVVVIAMVSTYICSALRVGGPGAYMFTLTCAAGTALPAAGMAPWQAGLLVLSGGAFAWVVHMVPALFLPRGPEKRAVAAAGRAVAAYARAAGTPRQRGARHRAALALSAAWAALVTYQPTHMWQGATLNRLQRINQQLHRLFAKTVRDTAGGEAPGPEVADQAVRLGFAAAKAPTAHWHGGSIPLGAPGPWEALRDGLRRGSVSQLVVLRVGVAALVAGVAAGLLDLERAYWAVAASVLILHAGMDWTRTLQRGAERLLGTWAGLLLAGLVLLVRPQGPWLALVVMAVQFTIESTVMRNYALAAVFITTAAITIASGGRQVADIPGLLLARGVDTTIGCVIALLVFVALTPRATLTRIPAAMAAILAAAGPVVDFLAADQAASRPAHHARRKLQAAVFAMDESYATAVGGSAVQRRAAERCWAAVSAAQGLAYSLLAACWMLEQHDGGAAGELAAELSAELGPGTGGAETIRGAFTTLATAIHTGKAPGPLRELPRFLRKETTALAESLPLSPAEGAAASGQAAG
ncbi:FUSC family protein [Arthrobacter sp. SDTb3-6]|uniref:FUSC family protein n=1 Tax=Arthrobacter sp. SDTb3-6 TaxID=2713571 RepID=UPI00159DA090|nr:FUSC family protein [Arthrobacter sp. SDTb3-6]NVM97281.1 FUSC family protein [Arthrobacter sp. SDTb3-6]